MNRETLSRYGPMQSLSLTIYMSIPYIHEIKTSFDWIVTKTSMGLFDWFKFEDVYNNFFKAKCNQISGDKVKIG